MINTLVRRLLHLGAIVTNLVLAMCTGYHRAPETVAAKLNKAVVVAGQRAVGDARAAKAYSFKESTWKVLEAMVAEVSLSA